jgi:hypothetical protein
MPQKTRRGIGPRVKMDWERDDDGIYSTWAAKGTWNALLYKVEEGFYTVVINRPYPASSEGVDMEDVTKIDQAIHQATEIFAGALLDDE